MTNRLLMKLAVAGAIAGLLAACDGGGGSDGSRGTVATHVSGVAGFYGAVTSRPK